MSAAALATALITGVRVNKDRGDAVLAIVREDAKKSLAILVRERRGLKVYTGNEARKILREENNVHTS